MLVCQQEKEIGKKDVWQGNEGAEGETKRDDHSRLLEARSFRSVVTLRILPCNDDKTMSQQEEYLR